MSAVEVVVPDGRVVVAHESGDRGAPTIVWHHGSPQTGALLAPVVDAAQSRGIRLLSCARPSYGGSDPRPGRDVASVAADIAAVADAMGVDRFAVMGASGGGPHALACVALLGDRVSAAVTFAGLAPFRGDPEWFTGMQAPGGLRAAVDGWAARAEHARHTEFDEGSFTDADWAALSGAWAVLGRDAGAAGAAGPDGLIDDDVAFTHDWGYAPGDVRAPVLLVHGGADRVVPVSHSRRLLDELPDAQFWFRPHDGHISVLSAVPVAMEWSLDVAT